MTKEEFLEEFFTVADERWIEEFLPQVILDTIENKEEFVQGKMSAETEWLLKGYVRDSSIKKLWSRVLDLMEKYLSEGEKEVIKEIWEEE